MTKKTSKLANQKSGRTHEMVGWSICALGTIFYCYEYFLRIEPSIMVPQLMRSFGIHAKTFGLLISLYYAVYTPMQAVVGLVTDLYGPRRVLTFAITVCVIGSYIFGSTESIYVAGFGRALIGFGSAFAFVGVLKLAAVWLPANRFALFAGLATALGMVGAMFGDVELAVLVNHLGWRETIFVGTVFGAFLIPIMWLVIRDKPKYPLPGVEPPVKLNLKETLKGFFECLLSPQMWIAGFIGTALYLSLTVFAELWGDQFLHYTYGLSRDGAALANSMVFFGWLVGAPVVGFLSDRLKLRRMPLGLGVILSFIVICIILYMPVLNHVVLFTLLVLFGAFSSAEIVCFAVGRENTRGGLAATAVAFINMLIMLGGLVFQPLVGALLDWHWSGAIDAGIRIYSGEDYRFALLIIPISLVVALILTFFLKETHARAPAAGRG